MSEFLTKGKIILQEVGGGLADFGIMLLVALTVQHFLVAPFVVVGASMETSLHDQEILLVDKMGLSKYITHDEKSLQHGDVVVFTPPNVKDTVYIKRVIGLPGDIIRFTDGDIFVNNTKLDESYTNCSRTESTADFPNANKGPCNYGLVDGKSFTVPQDHYFVMGDNRDRSSDSRSCFIASGAAECTTESLNHFVPYENILGKAMVVVWPALHLRGLGL